MRVYVFLTVLYVMYACVKYIQDNERAVLPTTLIKGFKPANAKALPKNAVFSEDGS